MRLVIAAGTLCVMVGIGRVIMAAGNRKGDNGCFCKLDSDCNSGRCSKGLTCQPKVCCVDSSVMSPSNFVDYGFKLHDFSDPTA